MVVNEILEKVRSQIPGTDSLMPPPKDTKVTLLNFLVRAEPLDCPGHINQHQTLGMEGWLTRSDTATPFGYSWCKRISSTERAGNGGESPYLRILLLHMCGTITVTP